jgi:YidC/Oxa1 family membrane protein insertase
MKKQSLVMKKMRPQLEKLQQQYANDKQMYNQKVMELQKKNGYSVFAACIPQIVSLVIFFVVFSAFSSYSQYANLESYNDMVTAYNGVVETFVYDETTNSDGFLIENEDKTDYYVDFDKFIDRYNKEKSAEDKTWVTKDSNGVFADLIELYNKDNTSNPLQVGIETQSEEIKISLISEYYINPRAAQAAADFYEEHNNSFLWVRNLWYPDSMLNKEIPSFSKFKSSISKAKIGDEYLDSYERVTANLTEQKDAYNGYFVLIVISIGGMILQQFLSMRANKDANELSTVDGSQNQMNKTMMIMMPIIYGVFAFLYSASFSLYMITNTFYSIITTLVINKIMDGWFKKKLIEEEQVAIAGKGSVVKTSNTKTIKKTKKK